ncbi:MAG: PA14 domain-containing protein, partial [Candidatus Omnitrophica bacterium]|nr:PA14 domain-containing protein [Candidatus Omnitrophota bacterium]
MVQLLLFSAAFGLIIVSRPAGAAAGTNKMIETWSFAVIPATTTLLCDQSAVSQLRLPLWDDARGTVYLDDGKGTLRAMAWTGSGYVLAENGRIIDRYPSEFPLPRSGGGRIFYVDSMSGNDSRSGLTQAQAWRTIAKVNATLFNPGDTILFARSGVWQEELVVSSSGNAAQVIKFGTYGTGVRPQIDAAYIFPHACRTNNQNYLWFDGFAFSRGAAAVPGEGTVWLQGDPTDITFTDCVFNDSRGNGCAVDGVSTGVRFRYCLFRNNGWSGVALSGFRLAGQHYYFICAYSYFDGNARAADARAADAGWYSESAAESGELYGCSLNTGKDTIIGYERQGGAATAFRIHDNVISGAGSLSALRTRSSSMSYRNRCYGASYAAHHCSQPNGRTVVISAHHNVLQAGRYGFSEEGIDKNEISGGAWELYYWNNTIDQIAGDNGAAGSGIRCDDGARLKIEAVNNIISRVRTNFIEQRQTPVSARYDYNVYYDSGLSGFSRTNVNYTFAQWQALGYDLNSVAGKNPLFVDPFDALWRNRNYRLSSGSPAIGAASADVRALNEPQSWIGINYVPHATSPDCGAYQTLSGKTLNFSRPFLGLRCASNKARRCILWDNALSAGELVDLTSASDIHGRSNLALKKNVVCSAQDNETTGAVANLVDGIGDNPADLWKAAGFPQWVKIDLGDYYLVSRAEIIPYGARAYRYAVQVKTEDNVYRTVVDRQANTAGGTAENPLVDEFPEIKARYVWFRVSGAANYAGTECAFQEVSIYGRPCSADTSAPTTPAEVTGVAVSAKEVHLSWQPSVDVVGIAEYRISRNGVQIAAVSAPQYTDSGLAANTLYTYTVFAVDTVGNVSAAATYQIRTPEQAVIGSGTGLTGQYYGGTGLSGTPLIRIDGTVDFAWGSAAPGAGVPADRFSARWQGTVQAQFSQKYTFYTLSDDGVRLWVNGKQLINNWTNHAAMENSGSITLTAGEEYALVLEYYDNVGNATLQLLWSCPGTDKQVIPRSQLYPAPVIGSGTGLTGRYYRAADLSGTPLVRLDGTVDFAWGSAAPCAGVPADGFSVRWQGTLQAQFSQKYTFYTLSDDGVRLWVNGKQLINNWTNHAAMENSG